MILLLVLVILICMVAVVVVYDVHRFVVRKYTFTGKKLKKSCRFVLLSDLHGKSFGKNNERLLGKIDELKPDGILIAGDMITAKPGKNFDETVTFIRTLADRYPVYYGSGNHEYRMGIYPEKYKDMSKRFERAIRHPNVIRLQNEKCLLPRENIMIYGLEIDREFYKKFHAPKMTEAYVRQKLGKPEKERYTMLIAHNPAYFPVYAEYGPDLVLSGHVHGGIARLPLLGGVISPTLRLFPKYDGGVFRQGKTTMVLSRGLGTHTLPVRFLNPGELIEIVLQPETEEKIKNNI